MSYKNDLETYKKQLSDRRNLTLRLIKISVIVLAAAILVTAVGAGATAVSLLISGEDFNIDNGKDTDAPIIKGPSEGYVIVYAGESVALKSFVSVSDNKDANCTLSVDKGDFNANKEGSYKITYTATDASGNTSKPYPLDIVVKNGTYSEANLMKLIDQNAKKWGVYTKEEAKGKSKTEIVKNIYNFVKDPTASANSANIKFIDSQSNTPNQLAQNGRQSRKDWKTDWIEEAYRTLSMDRMSGDCYTFYAVSKAFFEYFEIENCGIQRNTTEKELTGTHYWNIVKVEGGWYYFDSTRLAGKFSDDSSNSCLITESKLQSYKTSQGNPYFYKMNKTDPDFFDASANGGKFPKISTTPIK